MEEIYKNMILKLLDKKIDTNATKKVFEYVTSETCKNCCYQEIGSSPGLLRRQECKSNGDDDSCVFFSLFSD